MNRVSAKCFFGVVAPALRCSCTKAYTALRCLSHLAKEAFRRNSNNCKKILLCFLFFITKTTFGIDVYNLYQGSCRVNTGIILHVNRKTVHLLTLDGNKLELKRHEIVALARYSLPALPMTMLGEKNFVEPKMISFYGQNKQIVYELGSGWAIEYSKDYIQLLRNDGREQIIKRDDIWQVEFNQAAFNPKINFLVSQSFELRHPMQFEQCLPINVGSDQVKMNLIPNEIWASPIRLRRFFDHLYQGFKEIEEYEEHQRFYAIPQYYRNITRLGSWAIVGSRFTNIGARQINFLPLVENELSEGPFSYQRIIRSGVAPLDWSIHEEPILQAFYGLKADYIHLELFLDPSKLLLGNRYGFTSSLLGPLDLRFIESGGMEFGLDFGAYSFYLGSSGGMYGLRVFDFFSEREFSISHTSLIFQNQSIKMRYTVAKMNLEIDSKINFPVTNHKLQLQGHYNDEHKWMIIGINRYGKSQNHSSNYFNFETSDQTIAYQHDYLLTYRWQISVRVSANLRWYEGFNKKEKTGQSFKIASGTYLNF